MMIYSALDVAKWIISEARKRGIVMTHMKLQKLLYYAQAYAIGMTGTPLFKDEIQAWKHGPVVPSVYDSYNRYGANPIDDDRVAFVPEDGASFIRAILDDMGNKTASELRGMTHNEAPWKNAWTAWRGLGAFQPISVEAIREFYEDRFWGADEEDDYQPVFNSPEEEEAYFLKGITEEERNAILASR